MTCDQWVRFPQPSGGISDRVRCHKTATHTILHAARVEAITGEARVEVSLYWTTPGVDDATVEEDSGG